jgi:hypothetical protein
MGSCLQLVGDHFSPLLRPAIVNSINALSGTGSGHRLKINHFQKGGL